MEATRYALSDREGRRQNDSRQNRKTEAPTCHLARTLRCAPRRTQKCTASSYSTGAIHSRGNDGGAIECRSVGLRSTITVECLLESRFRWLAARRQRRGHRAVQGQSTLDAHGCRVG